MKKFADKVLSYTADSIIEALIAASGLASLGGTYQPKEPVGLKELIQKRQDESKA